MNSQRFKCLYFPSAGIKGMCHHAQPTACISNVFGLQASTGSLLEEHTEMDNTQTQPDRNSTEGTTRKNHGENRNRLPALQIKFKGLMTYSSEWAHALADRGPRNTRKV